MDQQHISPFDPDGSLAAIHRYQYQPLETPDTLRVLALHPSNRSSDPLNCDIIHQARKTIVSDFSTTQHYQAVSYTWDNQEVSHRIFCNGGATFLEITANVDSLLRQLRKIDTVRYLWIDAICLNQADEDEKSIQVMEMGEIYRTAFKVRIWLGEADENTSTIFTFLKALAAARKDESGEVEEWGLPPLALSGGIQLLMGFLCRPWFGRRWVIQEAAVGHVNILHCGNFKLPWRWFIDGLQVLWRVWKRRTNLSQFSLPGQLVDSLTTTCAISKPETPMLDLLWQFRASHCSDPKDRLFSLYGIANDVVKVDSYHPNRGDGGVYDSIHRDLKRRGIIPMTVDYSKSWPDTYTEFGWDCIGSGHGYALLRQVLFFGGLNAQNADWPSWVPDWTQNKQFKPLLPSQSTDDFVGLDDVLPNRVVILPGYSSGDILHRSRQWEGSTSPGNSFSSLSHFTNVMEETFPHVFGGTREIVVDMVTEGLHYGLVDWDPQNEDVLLECQVSSHQRYPSSRQVMGALGQRWVLEEDRTSEENASTVPEPPSRLQQLVDVMLSQYSLFQLDTGRIGIARATIQTGDLVVELVGVNPSEGVVVGCILRQIDFLSNPSLFRGAYEGKNAFRIVGSCLLRLDESDQGAGARDLVEYVIV